MRNLGVQNVLELAGRADEQWLESYSYKIINASPLCRRLVRAKCHTVWLEYRLFDNLAVDTLYGLDP